MRVGFWTLSSLALCAAAGGAALAHVTIDVVGDYALPADSYDHVAHGSRYLVAGLALFVAVVLAARGLRRCCEIAAANRTKLSCAAMRLREMLAFGFFAVLATCALVPGMECLDGRLAGEPVQQLGDAFGGSLLLGLVTSVACAALVAAVVFAFARWLISHRDDIVSIIATLLRHRDDAGARATCRRERPRPAFLRPAPAALRLSKRGPPAAILV